MARNILQKLYKLISGKLVYNIDLESIANVWFGRKFKISFYYYLILIKFTDS